jgi:hypothetical protein
VEAKGFKKFQNVKTRWINLWNGFRKSTKF